MRNGSNTSGTNRTVADEPVQIERGSGNVFADLDIPNPELSLAKAKLVQSIRGLLAEQKLSHAQVARLLGIELPKVVKLMRGRVEAYSIDRLFRFLNALGQHVEITVHPNAKHAAPRSVLVV